MGCTPTHAAYTLRDGQLVCATCGEPSPSKKWRQNVFGKAVEKAETENKALSWPPESKRLGRRR